MGLTAAVPLGSGAPGLRARRCTVRIEVDGQFYVGNVYVPDTKRRVSDVLSDDRPFLNMTEVQIGESTVVEPFLALNKRYILTMRVLTEEDIPVGPVRVPR